MKRLAVTMTILIIVCGLISGCTRKDVQSQSVDYQAGDLTMKGYLSYDRNVKAKRPGILIVHEWWGQDANARKRADMLADLGYVALAVDMFGNGKQADSATEAAEFAQEVTGSMEIEKARFIAALDYLKSQDTVDPDRIAAIGYSFGGHVVLEMARQGVDIDGVVSVYGGLTTNEPAPENGVRARILVQHGEKDWYVTVQQVTAFKSEMKNANADLQFIQYEGAEHGFANPDADLLKDEFNMHLGYSEAADKKSWEDMQGFLKKIFK